MLIKYSKRTDFEKCHYLCIIELKIKLLIGIYKQE